jgi:hypothetical protein
MISIGVLSQCGRLPLLSYMQMEGLSACRQGVLEKQYLADAESGGDKEQRSMKRASWGAHKLLYYKDLYSISLLQPTGTKSAQPWRFIQRRKRLAAYLAAVELESGPSERRD